MKKMITILGALLFACLVLPQAPVPVRAGAEAAGHSVTVVGEEGPSEAYRKENRKWQAIASVETTGSRLWAAWMTGGVTEPDPDNYIVVGFSDDNGASWVDPFLILDDGGKQATRLRDGVLWRDNEGALHLFYGYNGTWEITIPDPGAPRASLTVTEPRRVFSETVLNKPVFTSSGEWVVSGDPYIQDGQYREGHFLSSADGKTWALKGIAYSAADNKQWHEGTLVEKKDGTLWCLTRIESGRGGGLEEAFSQDGGATWTDYRSNLPAPLHGPGSKCCMRRLRSGALAFITNDSVSSRTALTVYLSEDDGATWPYSLLLDGRTGCAYPDIAEGKDGTIYAVWDFGRTVQNEIRLARFTEEDIRAGAFLSENAQNMINVWKDPAYRDIVQIEEEFCRTYTKKTGEITEEDILAALPASVTAVLEDGERIALSGEWHCNWFSSDTAGLYTFVFRYDEGALPEKAADNLGLLRVNVLIEEKGGMGPVVVIVCVAAGAAALAALAGVSAVILKKRRKNR